ncbi:MAG: hypothetical protein K5694_03415 [Bacilli bacterium]|nr:hypothetical protein [Bacilli bacterium]
MKYASIYKYFSVADKKKSLSKASFARYLEGLKNNDATKTFGDFFYYESLPIKYLLSDIETKESEFYCLFNRLTRLEKELFLQYDDDFDDEMIGHGASLLRSGFSFPFEDVSSFNKFYSLMCGPYLFKKEMNDTSKGNPEIGDTYLKYASTVKDIYGLDPLVKSAIFAFFLHHAHPFISQFQILENFANCFYITSLGGSLLANQLLGMDLNDKYKLVINPNNHGDLSPYVYDFLTKVSSIYSGLLLKIYNRNSVKRDYLNRLEEVEALPGLEELISASAFSSRGIDLDSYANALYISRKTSERYIKAINEAIPLQITINCKKKYYKIPR